MKVKVTSGTFKSMKEDKKRKKALMERRRLKKMRSKARVTVKTITKWRSIMN